MKTSAYTLDEYQLTHDILLHLMENQAIELALDMDDISLERVQQIQRNHKNLLNACQLVVDEMDKFQ